MPADDPTNGRVTVAILATKLDHLTEEIRQYRSETKEQLGQCRAEAQRTSGDHEQRLRSLEGSSRQSMWRDVGAFLSAVAAGVVGWLAKSP